MDTKVETKEETLGDGIVTPKRRGNPFIKPGPGRPKNSQNKNKVALILSLGAPGCAEVLVKAGNGKLKVTREQLEAAKTVVAHAIGTPASKTELTSDVQIRIITASPPADITITSQPVPALPEANEVVVQS